MKNEKNESKVLLNDVCSGPGNLDALDIHKQRGLSNDVANLKGEEKTKTKNNGCAQQGTNRRPGASWHLSKEWCPLTEVNLTAKLKGQCV